MSKKPICFRPVVHLIGDVAVSFGILELYLELGIWQLIAGADEARRRLAEAITAEMSFDRKVHAFATIYSLRFPAEADDTELKQLIADLFTMQDRRNAVLHSAWVYSDKYGAFMRMKASAKAKHGFRRRMSVVEPDDLAALQNALAEVGQRFAYFSLKRIQERM